MPILSSFFKQLTRSAGTTLTSVRVSTSELSNILLTRPLDNQGESYDRLLDRGILNIFEESNIARYGDADGTISIPTTDNYNSFLSDSILPNLDLSSVIKPISNNDSTQFLSEYRSQQTVLFDLFKPIEEVIQTETSGSVGDDQNNVFTDRSALSQSYDGGNGIDTFSTNLFKFYYKISTSHIRPDEITLSHFPGKTIELKNIERLEFLDTNLAFDLYGNAGMVAKIYGAVLGKDSLLDSDLIGDGLDAVDSGMSYENFATITLQSTGIQTNAEIVRTLWTNVVGSAPTADQEQPFISKLDSGEQSVGELVMFAADTSLNQENINLIGLTSSGIEYA